MNPDEQKCLDLLHGLALGEMESEKRARENEVIERARDPHITERRSVDEGMENSLSKIADLIFGASTALSNQWCESDIKQLEDLAQVLRRRHGGYFCCGQSLGKIEFTHGKDGEFVRCRNCGTSFGSAVGLLIANRLFAKDNHELFYKTATLRQQVLDLTEALKHYADENNWENGMLQTGEVYGDALYDPIDGPIEARGYDIARAALDKIQGEKG